MGGPTRLQHSMGALHEAACGQDCTTSSELMKPSIYDRLRYYVGGFIVTLGIAILMFAIIWLVFSIGQP